MTVKGGTSRGALSSDSENGLTFFGLSTSTSSLHQDTYNGNTNNKPGAPEVTNVNEEKLTPRLLIFGLWMFSQHGPIIFRFKTNSSNALVLVP